MDKIRKGSKLRKEIWGSPSIQESKFAAKFSKRLYIRTVTSLRDIFKKTWVHSYPVMPQATLCPREDQTLARCHVCLPSWSAMHDLCLTCARKCAVAMGANVVKETSFGPQKLAKSGRNCCFPKVEDTQTIFCQIVNKGLRS